MGVDSQLKVLCYTSHTEPDMATWQSKHWALSVFISPSAPPAHFFNNCLTGEN